MTTPFLPPIIPSPFGKAFVRKPYILSDVGYIYSNGAGTFHYDHLESSSRTSRAVSVPAPTSPPRKSSNDENARHCYHLEGSSRSPDRRAYSLNAAHPASRGSVNCSAQPFERPFQQTETFPIFEDPLVRTENEAEDMQHRAPDRSSDQSWNWPPNGSAKTSCDIDDELKNGTAGLLAHLSQREPEPDTTSTTLLDKSIGKTAENFRRWASTFRHKRNQHSYKCRPAMAEQELPTDIPSALPTMSFKRNWHTKRISNASSRFVATVKTASLSNDSMSLLPRPHRYSRVSDPRATRSSDPRPSVDSQRPSSISSSDEGALRRSIRRRQILQEVLSSEESYVADLKALYSLFSTLLVSVPSISAQTRTSIQRDVTEMLHLHEQIVNELHRVALRATLREWRYVASPLRLSRKRHRKWQSLDAASFHPSLPKASHTRMVVNGVDMRSRGSSAHAADPAEVADVAQVFRNHMTQFYVYEEYSAKYEMMVQELAHSHKNVPHWAWYEAGMEALAKSLASLDQRGVESRKGLTTGDLLIKPIQRICKYPLFFSDLHKQTPVVDCPISHAEVEGILSILRQMVGEINLATDNPRARERIQRRWLLQNRLKLGQNTLKSTQFRMLGHVLLCGVLHVAYQTSHRVEGGYMLCLMFKEYLLVAAPALEQGNFDVVATIYLSDAKAMSSEDGRGLQCHSALFSWKLIFESDGRLFELMFSACSATEQQQWLAGIERGRSLLALEGAATQPSVPDLSTTVSLDLKALAPVFGQGGTLARRLSIQRAATVGTRVATCQVIIRNTHKPQDGQDSKHATAQAVNRSQSLLTTHRIAVLAPKRSERVRLEQSLADVWTRDTLPYPGMSLPRGGNIIRASAGSLVRKLSLASIHTPFAKRSTSMTLVGSRFSHDTTVEVKQEMEQHGQTQGEPLSHEIILDDHDELCDGEKLSEEEMVPPPALPPSRLSFTAIEKLRRRSTRKVRRVSKDGTEPGPEPRPTVEVAVDVEISEGNENGDKNESDVEIEAVEDRLRRKKRWSNPLGLLKSLSAEGVRHLLYSSK